MKELLKWEVRMKEYVRVVSNDISHQGIGKDYKVSPIGSE